MQSARAVEQNAARPGMIAADWKPYAKGSLKGFFTLSLSSGLVLNGLMLHQKNDARWIGFPAREYLDSAGNRQYSKFIEFRDRASADRFRDAALAALDLLLVEEGGS